MANDVDLFDLDLLGKLGMKVEKGEEEEEIILDEPLDEEEEEEEKIIKTAQGDPISTEGNEEDEEDDDSPLLNFARLLKENGVLPDADFKTIKNSGDLIGLVSAQIQSENEKYKNSLPDPHRDIQDLLEKGFTSQEIREYKTNEMTLANISPEDLEESFDLQRSVYEVYLKTQNYSDKHIKKLLNVNEVEIKEESLLALSALKENLKDEMQEIAQTRASEAAQIKASNQKILDDLRLQAESTEEVIPGRKIPLAQRKKLFDMIVNPIKTESGIVNAIQKTREEDPMKFDITLAYLINQGVFSGKWDSIMKVAKTQATKEFETSLYNSARSTGKAGNQTQEMSVNAQTKKLIDGLRHKL